MLTLQEKSAAASDRSNGFDYLRIFLAVAIVAWHSVSISYGGRIEEKYFSELRPLILTLVPSFFALSGYLVAGSLFRTNHLPAFLTLRALRIFPALCCEVVISAFIIGAALTSLPLSDYFSNSIFSDYFLNVFGYIHYSLPGVFEHNQYGAVNAQLWTIPYELECYIAIAILYVVTLHRRPKIFFTLLFIFTIAATVNRIFHGANGYGFQPSGRAAVAAFLWGVAIYTFRDVVKHNKYIVFASMLFVFLILHKKEWEFMAAPAIAYFTIYVGLCNFKKSFVLLAGDISYGIYLYGFVIQQAVYQMTPVSYRSWAENFFVSIVVACIFGYVSWTFVESKVLNHKKRAIKSVKSVTDWFTPAKVPKI